MTVKVSNTYGDSLLVSSYVAGDINGGDVGQPALTTPAPAAVFLLISGVLNHTTAYFTYIDLCQVVWTFNGETVDSGLLAVSHVGVDRSITYSLDPVNDTTFFADNRAAQHLDAGVYPLTADFKAWNHVDPPGSTVHLITSEDVTVTGFESLALNLSASHGPAGYHFVGD